MASFKQRTNVSFEALCACFMFFLDCSLDILLACTTFLSNVWYGKKWFKSTVTKIITVYWFSIVTIMYSKIYCDIFVCLIYNYFTLIYFWNFIYTFCRAFKYMYIWSTSWENLFTPYANNKAADQPAHPSSPDQHLCCSLPGSYNTSTCYSRNLKTLASLYSCAGWSQIPKTGFTHDVAHIVSVTM